MCGDTASQVSSVATWHAWREVQLASDLRASLRREKRGECELDVAETVGQLGDTRKRIKYLARRDKKVLRRRHSVG